MKKDIRKSKTITKKEDIEFLVNLTEHDITQSLFLDLFGEYDGEVKFRPYDIITIPANSYGPKGKKNKESFTTTIGIWLFNKYFIEEELFDIFHYLNEECGDSLYSSILSRLSQLVLEEKLPIDKMKSFLMKSQKTMPLVTVISPSFTEKMLTCSRDINIKKKELLDKYRDGIEKGDPIIADKMMKELLAYAKEYMEGDPSMDMYLSGARGSFNNNFKNMFVMKGIIANPDPNAKQKYTVAKSCYIDGISPEEYVLFANSLAAGPYARSKKTATGGYLEKQFLAAFQNIQLLPAGSDCGTKKTIKVKINKKNAKLWMYSYIVEGSKLVELTSDNINKYMDKEVKMRFSGLCEAKDGFRCNKCMGNLPYRRGSSANIGTALTVIPSTLKNISMKSFHDSTQKLVEMDINKAFNITT